MRTRTWMRRVNARPVLRSPSARPQKGRGLGAAAGEHGADAADGSERPGRGAGRRARGSRMGRALLRVAGEGASERAGLCGAVVAGGTGTSEGRAARARRHDGGGCGCRFERHVAGAKTDLQRRGCCPEGEAMSRSKRRRVCFGPGGCCRLLLVMKARDQTPCVRVGGKRGVAAAGEEKS